MAGKERPEAWEANKEWVPNHVERSTGPHPGPYEMTVHFGMRVWRLAFWPARSDTHTQRELATPQKPANDKLRTLRTDRLSMGLLGPELRYHTAAFPAYEVGVQESGSHLGARFGITAVNSKQPLTQEQTWSSPTQASVQTPLVNLAKGSPLPPQLNGSIHSAFLLQLPITSRVGGDWNLSPF